MMADQAEQLRLLMSTPTSSDPVKPPSERRVIAVASGKGGVGKTNFCVNFALGLQRLGHTPIVIDADLGFADVEVLLGVQPKKTLVDVLNGVSIWEAVETDSADLPFLSAGSGLLHIHELTSVQMERLMVQMNQLHEKYDTVIIDSGAGMGPNLGRLLTAADDLILVTTPEPTSIADAYALMKMLVSRGTLPTTQIVVNRVTNFVQGRHTAEKLKMVADRFLDLKLTLLGYVLEDQALPDAVMQQSALLSAFPNSPAAKCFHQLVQNYLRIEPVIPRKGIAGFFERVLHKIRLGGGVDTSHPA